MKAECYVHRRAGMIHSSSSSLISHLSSLIFSLLAVPACGEPNSAWPILLRRLQSAPRYRDEVQAMLHQADPGCKREPAQRPAPVPRVLVTGVDGAVGANIALWLGRRAEVFGLYEDHQVALPGCEIDRWDPRRPAMIRGMVRGAGPNWIVHCGPLACGSWDLFQNFRRSVFSFLRIGIGGRRLLPSQL